MKQILIPSAVSSLKAFARRLLAEGCYRSGLTRRDHRGKVLILTYHRVLPDDEVPHWVQPGMYVTQSVFLDQMKFLRRNYEILPLHELLEFWDEGRPDDNQRYCVITFDDGWRDNYLHAYPILKTEKIPATIFLPVSYIGSDRWFWTDRLAYLLNAVLSDVESRRRLSWFPDDFAWLDGSWMSEERSMRAAARSDYVAGVIERAKACPLEQAHRLIGKLSDLLELEPPTERVFLSWEEIEVMSQCGVTFGSHSCNHRILTNLSLDEAQMEMEESKRVLESKGSGFLPVFCYPDGRANGAVRELVRKSGYSAAVGGRFGLENYRPEDRFWIRRIGIHQDISHNTPLFAYRLTGKSGLGLLKWKE